MASQARDERPREHFSPAFDWMNARRREGLALVSRRGMLKASLAGGCLRQGQVIGASDREGAQIQERPVTPGDLASTTYRHMCVPLDAVYTDPRGRPRRIADEGSPLPELFGS